MPIIATTTTFTNPVTRDPQSGAGVGFLGANGRVTYDTIRQFLRDQSQHNILAFGQIEFSDTVVEQAIMMACSEFNSIAPLTQRLNLDGSDWPVEFPHLLILGSCSYLLKGEASKQVRNQFNAQDGNMPQVGVHDKYGLYMSLAEAYQQEFRAGVSRVKIMRDAEASYGFSTSPLSRRSSRWL